MAKRKCYARVCQCTPNGDVSTRDVQVLNQLVEEQERAMEREHNTRKMARMAMELGDVCLASGCPMRAIQVWRKAAEELESRDYFWVGEPINPAFMRFDDLVSEHEARELGRRIDKAWRVLGHPELATWEWQMKRNYRWMWLDEFWESLP